MVLKFHGRTTGKNLKRLLKEEIIIFNWLKNTEREQERNRERDWYHMWYAHSDGLTWILYSYFSFLKMQEFSFSFDEGLKIKFTLSLKMGKWISSYYGIHTLLPVSYQDLLWKINKTIKFGKGITSERNRKATGGQKMEWRNKWKAWLKGSFGSWGAELRTFAQNGSRFAVW